MSTCVDFELKITGDREALLATVAALKDCVARFPEEESNGSYGFGTAPEVTESTTQIEFYFWTCRHGLAQEFLSALQTLTAQRHGLTVHYVESSDADQLLSNLGLLENGYDYELDGWDAPLKLDDALIAHVMGTGLTPELATRAVELIARRIREVGELSEVAIITTLSSLLVEALTPELLQDGTVKAAVGELRKHVRRLPKLLEDGELDDDWDIMEEQLSICEEIIESCKKAVR